ncbi:hypothetical protein [Flavobacterium selenitireducens]|uniref:hypothetical protein n=1 Tax=Flavobacterium selenitireducens TaxID=2722704 RepID=UPI00168ADF93|nr:hypothetical protein [Flavobacterium selenitireducens]MBD3582864.1 hypothetical protein [Flavobacterium selenitireducens]
MYATGLFLHSITRWAVLIALLLAIYKSARGYFRKRDFTKSDNSIRHWTATIGHIQLMIGMFVYTQSPMVAYFWANKKEAVKNADALFFGAVHILLMFAAVILMTIASAKAKREATSSAKFKTMLVYFSIALVIIFLAIPWPFSPFVQRPLFR